MFFFGFPSNWKLIGLTTPQLKAQEGFWTSFLLMACWGGQGGLRRNTVIRWQHRVGEIRAASSKVDIRRWASGIAMFWGESKWMVWVILKVQLGLEVHSNNFDTWPKWSQQWIFLFRQATISNKDYKKFLLDEDLEECPSLLKVSWHDR